MKNLTNINKTSKNAPCFNKLQHKLVVLISTLDYINKKYKKYTQKTYSITLMKISKEIVKLPLL